VTLHRNRNRNPTQPNPTQPNPIQPNPTQLNPTQSNPIQPNPTQSNPTQPVASSRVVSRRVAVVAFPNFQIRARGANLNVAVRPGPDRAPGGRAARTGPGKIAARGRNFASYPLLVIYLYMYIIIYLYIYIYI
jgi:hypothetical protein